MGGLFQSDILLVTRRWDYYHVVGMYKVALVDTARTWLTWSPRSHLVLRGDILPEGRTHVIRSSVSDRTFVGQSLNGLPLIYSLQISLDLSLECISGQPRGTAFAVIIQCDEIMTQFCVATMCFLKSLPYALSGLGSS